MTDALFGLEASKSWTLVRRDIAVYETIWTVARKSENPGVFCPTRLYNDCWVAWLEYFADFVLSFFRHDSLPFNSIHAKFWGIAYTAQQVWTEVTTRLYSLTRHTQLSSRDAIWWIYTIRIWTLQRLQSNKFECVISVCFMTPEGLFYFAGSHSSYSTTRRYSVLWLSYDTA
jgi:hypothetical protein